MYRIYLWQNIYVTSDLEFTLKYCLGDKMTRGDEMTWGEEITQGDDMTGGSFLSPDTFWTENSQKVEYLDWLIGSHSFKHQMKLFSSAIVSYRLDHHLFNTAGNRQIKSIFKVVHMTGHFVHRWLATWQPRPSIHTCLALIIVVSHLLSSQ